LNALSRALGEARIEGRDYVMQDGDVVEFRRRGTSGSGGKK
jgi:ribosome-binding ATPase YchF (GTP1/OBG family)